MPQGMVVLTVNHHHLGPREAETTIVVGETKGLCHLISHFLSPIVGLRATGAHYQWLPQCSTGLIDQILAFPKREMALGGWSSYEDKCPHLQRQRY